MLNYYNLPIEEETRVPQEPAVMPAGGEPPLRAPAPQPEPELEQQSAPEPELEFKPEPKPRRAPKDRTERGAAVVLAALTLLLGGTAVLLGLRAGPVTLDAFLPGQTPAIMLPALDPAPSVPLQRAPNGDGTVLALLERPQGAAMTLQEIYKQVSPSVVFIRAATQKGIAQGTGVVMSADGYVITNAHVIEDSFRVDVVLEDGRQYEALLVGSDESTDLAVLKLDVLDLTPAVFGDSNQMEVGDMVAAIGNPMGEELRGTMTDGILSAINRDMDVDGQQMTLLQTTAALNTGNSGGALINEMGQVIGITNMKMMAYNSTVEGLGFAIPTTTAKLVVDDLIAYGVVKGRPMLGITVRPMDDAERQERELEYGLRVEQVEAQSDAWTQGIRAGDVLLSANGVDLYFNDDLLTLKDALQVGESIAFQVWREGEVLDLTVALMEQYTFE